MMVIAGLLGLLATLVLVRLAIRFYGTRNLSNALDILSDPKQLVSPSLIINDLTKPNVAPERGVDGAQRIGEGFKGAALDSSAYSRDGSSRGM